MPWEICPLSRPKLSLFSFQQQPCSALNNRPGCPSVTGRELGDRLGPRGCGAPRARNSGSSTPGLCLEHWQAWPDPRPSFPQAHPVALEIYLCKLQGRAALDGRCISLPGPGRGAKSERGAPHARRPWSLWSPFSHPSSQKEVNPGTTQVERMERSQTSKLCGSGVGSQALATAAA